jgi:hypothetical protein
VLRSWHTEAQAEQRRFLRGAAWHPRPKGRHIERRWLDVHANVTRCRTLTKLMRRVRTYLLARDEQGSPGPSLRQRERARTG